MNEDGNSIGMLIGVSILLFYAVIASWSIISLSGKNEKMLKLVKKVYIHARLHYVHDIREVIEESVPESAGWIEEEGNFTKY